MTRFLDWPVRLNEYILEAEKKEFKLGTHDCCTFAAGAIEAMTGEDPMPEFRGLYNDWQSAEDVLDEVGYDNLYKTLTKKFGKAIIGQKGQKGDLAFYEGSCGIVLGRYALFLGEKGSAYVSLQKLQRAFRIPYYDPNVVVLPSQTLTLTPNVVGTENLKR